MESSDFYKSILASGLVLEEPLEKIARFIQERTAGSASTLDTILFDISTGSPVSIEQQQRLPALKTFKPGPLLENHTSQPAVADSLSLNKKRGQYADAVLDVSQAEHNPAEHKLCSGEDTLLADGLVRQGLLNRWQAEQLLEGRTKFTLGDYRIFDAIGRGGYGYVFLGRKMSPDENAGTLAQTLSRTSSPHAFYAVKILPGSKATPELLCRFAHEIELQKNLRHPHLVRYIESGQDGSVRFMVHEFMDGGDLRALLKQTSTLPIDTASAIIVQIAQAVQYLHDNGIIHRDIKPANILLASDGTAKLIDLGLAVHSSMDNNPAPAQLPNGNPAANRQVFADETPLPHSKQPLEERILRSEPGRVAGTVDYMSPDQLRNPVCPIPAWDIYSLGCTLYQMLTGTVPLSKAGQINGTQEKILAKLQFEPKDVRIYNQAIPYDIADLLQMMLTSPSDHCVTAQHIADRLANWTRPEGLTRNLKFG